MTIRHGIELLPERTEALDKIRGFNELDPDNIGNYRVLARTLSGLSLAVSSVALEYGEVHRPPGIDDIDTNIGLWTELGEGHDKHKFTASPQDRLGLTGAHIWRSAIEGGKTEYYDSVSIPTEKVLQGFLDTNPSDLRQGWDKPSWTDIYAARVRGQSIVHTPVHQIYWPFHKPLEKTQAGYPTPEERAKGYTQILQELSRTLIEIVEK